MKKLLTFFFEMKDIWHLRKILSEEILISLSNGYALSFTKDRTV